MTSKTSTRLTHRGESLIAFIAELKTYVEEHHHFPVHYPKEIIYKSTL